MPKPLPQQFPKLRLCCYAIPAYGRKYETKDAIKADWEAGKDFKILNGPYFSIRDLDAMKALYYAIHFESLSLIEMSAVSFTITLEEI